MEEGKILNVCKPLISCLPRDNFILSVLSNNKEILDTFILNHYIDTYTLYNKKCHDYNLRFSDSLHCFVSKKYFHYVFNPRVMIEDLCVYVEKCIDNDYYTLLEIDAFYIPLYNSNSHYTHEIMIYGYDFCKRIFYVRDFFDGQNYEVAECSYENMVKAFKGVNENKLFTYYDGILALKLNEKYDVNIYKDEKKTKIFNFNNYSFGIDKYKNYGGSIFDSLIVQLNDEKNINAPYTFLVIHMNFIKIHIDLMLYRVKVLINFGYTLEEQLSKLISIKKEAEIYLNKFIKYKLNEKRYQNTLSENISKKIIILKNGYLNILSQIANVL